MNEIEFLKDNGETNEFVYTERQKISDLDHLAFSLPINLLFMEQKETILLCPSFLLDVVACEVNFKTLQ